MKLEDNVIEMLKKNEKDDYINEIKDLTIFFNTNHISKLTPSFRPGNMIGQNCIVLLQTNLYRIKLLCYGYVNGLNMNTPIISTLSLRAILETTGSLAFLLKKYNQYKSGELSQDEFEENIKRLYLGLKDKRNLPEAPDPINVMTLIDAVDHYLKIHYKFREKKFRLSYDDLSERCHPNSFGYLLGHKIDEKFTVNFSDDSTIHSPIEYDLEYFSITIKLYKDIYRELRNKIEENEEIPFKELYHFKNYKWKSGPNKSPFCN